jgi:hypothetical protein
MRKSSRFTGILRGIAAPADPGYDVARHRLVVQSSRKVTATILASS